MKFASRAPCVDAALVKAFRLAMRAQGLAGDAAARTSGSANPSKRFGRPGAFGMCCAFVASAHARYMTGQYICVDGNEHQAFKSKRMQQQGFAT
jgi:NAD(P)-dependent dehydrogenase (short-subunit alcohol dehydrogenase family)